MLLAPEVTMGMAVGPTNAPGARSQSCIALESICTSGTWSWPRRTAPGRSADSGGVHSAGAVSAAAGGGAAAGVASAARGGGRGPLEAAVQRPGKDACDGAVTGPVPGTGGGRQADAPPERPRPRPRRAPGKRPTTTTDQRIGLRAGTPLARPAMGVPGFMLLHLERVLPALRGARKGYWQFP
jgi:hypothetical protein